MSNSVAVRARRTGEDWTCEVEVDDRGRRSRHTVLVTPQDLARWGRGGSDGDVEDLVQRSFDFLLAREAPASILRRFDLEVIQRYFPEYDREFTARSDE